MQSYSITTRSQHSGNPVLSRKSLPQKKVYDEREQNDDAAYVDPE